MSPDPNKPGSSDESDSGDDLRQTYDSQAEIPSSESVDPDATNDSMDQRQDLVPNQDDSSTADSVEKTLDSVNSLDSTHSSLGEPDPSTAYELEATFDSHAASHSDSDDFSNLTEMSLDMTDASGINTRRVRETAEQIDATLVGVPGAMEVAGNDDDFQFIQSKLNKGLPSHIGRYEIKRLLGEGTFGKVYEARDPQLDRIVAVKVAKAISGLTQVKRFLREARAAAQLRHPSIIPVYEYGQVDGENIIVYEFVAGETLKSYIKRRKSLPINESVEIIRQIAVGMNYAHEQGIIHRDMKPDNVLIDPSGHPHIADFGCARSIEDKTNLTIDGSILGTPMYMSPEQAGGRSNVADGRTDIWSLGVMLYEMASGKKPFEGRLADLLFSICNKDPSPLRKIRPDAPLDIETICSKCLSRELDNRYATAQILADELGRFQRGEPIESRRIGTIQRTWMWAKRNQAVASLISAVVITMLIGTILSTTFAIKAYREQVKRDMADRNRAIAQMQALTTSVAGELPGIFESLTPFQATILPMLYDKLDDVQTTADERPRLRMAIVELEQDPVLREQQAVQLVDYLLVADPEDFRVTRDCLDFCKQAMADQLWTDAEDSTDSSSRGRRFRAAAALAQYDPGSPSWFKIAPDVADHLTSLNETEASKWLPALAQIRNSLKPKLKVAYKVRADASDNTPQRTAAILASLFVDDVEFLVSLIPIATAQQLPYLTDALGKHQSQALEQLRKTLKQENFAAASGTSEHVQKSNLVMALIQLKDQSQWNELKSGSDTSVPTELIERLGPASTSVDFLTAQIKNRESVDPDVLAGILLSLGQYKPNQILRTRKDDLRSELLDIFSNHSNARVHSCARWILQQWGEDLTLLENALRSDQPKAKMKWHVDMAGNTFALFGPIDNFEMGLNDQMATGSGLVASEILDEPRHRKSIPRRFGICIHEVTNVQFEEFEMDIFKEHELEYQQRLKELQQAIVDLENVTESVNEETNQKNAKKRDELELVKRQLESGMLSAKTKRDRFAKLDKQLPVADVVFFRTLAYCRWLSNQQKIECGSYPTVKFFLQVADRKTDFIFTHSHVDHLGYRLPTATEWEYACRGRSETLFPFGRSTTNVAQYAWYATNSDASPHPVGKLKPGNTGLFDILGNVSEWCLDWYHEKLPSSSDGQPDPTYVDFGPDLANQQSHLREYRGGSFMNEIYSVRSTKRFSARPITGLTRIGFRLARTYEPSPSVESPTATTESE